MNAQNSQRRGPSVASRYNPITADQIARPWDDGTFDLTKTLSKESRMLAVPFFGLLFVAENVQLAIGPLSILLLFGCLYYRMDERMRQIASIPLAFSTFLLVIQVGFGRGMGIAAFASGVQPLDTAAWGMPFVPLFLAACLYFIPLRDTSTFKLITADSFLLLASGLVPGQGFVAVFYLVHYTLSIAVVIAIFSDLKNHDVKSFFSESQAAAQ
jgi:hypothetical protein